MNLEPEKAMFYLDMINKTTSVKNNKSKYFSFFFMVLTIYIAANTFVHFAEIKFEFSSVIFPYSNNYALLLFVFFIAYIINTYLKVKEKINKEQKEKAVVGFYAYLKMPINESCLKTLKEDKEKYKELMELIIKSRKLEPSIHIEKNFETMTMFYKYDKMEKNPQDDKEEAIDLELMEINEIEKEINNRKKIKVKMF